jgi:curved DNA-binding protein CbpA
MNIDFYAVLGVSPTATSAEIKSRYRFLSHAYHPDKFGTDAHRQTAELEFKRINEAYRILSDPTYRAKFDASRSHYSKPQASTPRQAPTQAPPTSQAEPFADAPKQKNDDDLRTATIKAYAKQFGIGLLTFIFGMGISLLSAMTTKPGGFSFVACGIIFAGFVTACKGLAGLIRTLGSPKE